MTTFLAVTVTMKSTAEAALDTVAGGAGDDTIYGGTGDDYHFWRRR